MRVLHICSYYIVTELYKNLFKQLSDADIQQEVFIPVKREEYCGKNQLVGEQREINYHYENCLRIYDRVLYRHKIKKQLRLIEKDVSSIDRIDYIHAHTVFSDGGTAYLLHKKYNASYIVAVRNTDINAFYKYGIHLRPFMYKVLTYASAIVFISEAYKQQMYSILPPRILAQVESKFQVIPNGIDEYWHKHSPAEKMKKEEGSKQLALLFIGTLKKNKNLDKTISTVPQLGEAGYQVSLEVLGEGPLKEEYQMLGKKLNVEENITFHGHIKDRRAISEIMDRCQVFVMPSLKETFGLVFIEAMSRGIPVIYATGQGIDGFFQEGEIGYSVDPSNIEMITEAIKKIMARYDEISQRCLANSKSFNWERISREYLSIYENKRRNYPGWMDDQKKIANR